MLTIWWVGVRVSQAHADALGTWGRVEGATGAAARRGWEGDGRMDLRSVANTLRQLPYHVAWQRGFRQVCRKYTMHLNPKP